jgi:hypothetical protein
MLVSFKFQYSVRSPHLPFSSNAFLPFNFSQQNVPCLFYFSLLDCHNSNWWKTKNCEAPRYTVFWFATRITFTCVVHVTVHNTEVTTCWDKLTRSINSCINSNKCNFSWQWLTVTVCVRARVRACVISPSPLFKPAFYHVQQSYVSITPSRLFTIACLPHSQHSWISEAHPLQS